MKKDVKKFEIAKANCINDLKENHLAHYLKRRVARLNHQQLARLHQLLFEFEAQDNMREFCGAPNESIVCELSMSARIVDIPDAMVESFEASKNEK